MTLLAELSPTMREALEHVLPGSPSSTWPHQREPERWIRCTPKRTAEALERRGLIAGWWPDNPIGGFRGELTPAGMALRAELRGADR